MITHLKTVKHAKQRKTQQKRFKHTQTCQGKNIHKAVKNKTQNKKAEKN